MLVQNLEKLQIRTINAHTIFLGMGNEWSRLSLPWISRDIAMLIAQLEEPEINHDDPLERLSLLKMFLTQLSGRFEHSKSSINEKTEKEKIELSPKAFYREAEPIALKELVHHKASPKLIVRTDVSELLLHEEVIKRHEGLISLLVYSDQAVMLGSVLSGSRHCLFCYRHLLAVPFGLRNPNKVEEENRFLELGMQLGSMVERKLEENLLFNGESIELTPMHPFIGCPHCFQEEKSSC